MAKPEQDMTSLLDAIVEKKAHNSESKSMIFSLVYVSRLSGGSMERKTIGSHYEQLAKECQNRYQVDGPTGLLLVYPMHCVHILEVSAQPCTHPVSPGNNLSDLSSPRLLMKWCLLL
jgi:hypothetical protein